MQTLERGVVMNFEERKAFSTTKIEERGAEREKLL